MAAHKHTGLEHRAIISNLGKAKIACMDDKVEQAYSDAAKLRGAAQQAPAHEKTNTLILLWKIFTGR